jgi:hypothetical protein
MSKTSSTATQNESDDPEFTGQSSSSHEITQTITNRCVTLKTQSIKLLSSDDNNNLSFTKKILHSILGTKSSEMAIRNHRRCRNLMPRLYQPPATHHHHSSSNIYSKMTRIAFMPTIAIPKQKFRKFTSMKATLNSHSPIQETELLRVEPKNNDRSIVIANANSKKPLHESVIQSKTQIAQIMGLDVIVNKGNTMFDFNQIPLTVQTPFLVSQTPQHQQIMCSSPSPKSVPINQSKNIAVETSEKICKNELGSGASMTIKNYGHIKCSLCQTLISDRNVSGKDYHVRNSRVHCHNCFSNKESKETAHRGSSSSTKQSRTFKTESVPFRVQLSIQSITQATNKTLVSIQCVTKTTIRIKIFNHKNKQIGSLIPVRLFTCAIRKKS